MHLQKTSLFGLLDLVELATVISVSLITVWIVPQWLLPLRTLQLQLHIAQVFFNCITQPITSSRFYLAMIVLLVDSASTVFQYGIWSLYVDGVGLDVYTGVDWKERMKFGLVLLLFITTASRAMESRVEVKAAMMVRDLAAHSQKSKPAPPTGKHPFGYIEVPGAV